MRAPSSVLEQWSYCRSVLSFLFPSHAPGLLPKSHLQLFLPPLDRTLRLFSPLSLDFFLFILTFLFLIA